jgi:hypothetical protein
MVQKDKGEGGEGECEITQLKACSAAVRKKLTYNAFNDGVLNDRVINRSDGRLSTLFRHLHELM